MAYLKFFQVLIREPNHKKRARVFFKVPLAIYRGEDISKFFLVGSYKKYEGECEGIMKKQSANTLSIYMGRGT